MSIGSIFGFAIAYFLVALSPGPGLATILSRAMNAGMCAGFAVTAGLVVGDAIFLVAAIAGLSAVASTLGSLFEFIRYAGAGYLLWLGIETFRKQDHTICIKPKSSVTPTRDIGLGLLVTMGNPKAILFYGAILPTFIDLQKVTTYEYFILVSIAASISFLVYGTYIVLVERSRKLLASTKTARRINQFSGVVLIGSGITVASR